MKGEVRFAKDSGMEKLGGMKEPISEMALEMEVGPCSRCGKSSLEAFKGGMLINVTVLDGVMRGDSVCFECMDEEEREPMVNLSE